MGLCACGVRDPCISNLVAVLRMRGCLRIELREGRGLVDHLAAILGRLPEGLFVIEHTLALDAPAIESASNATALIQSKAQGDRSGGPRVQDSRFPSSGGSGGYGEAP